MKRGIDRRGIARLAQVRAFLKQHGPTSVPDIEQSIGCHRNTVRRLILLYGMPDDMEYVPTVERFYSYTRGQWMGKKTRLLKIKETHGTEQTKD